MSEYTDLVAQAKAAGINTFQMSAAKLRAALMDTAEGLAPPAGARPGQPVGLSPADPRADRPTTREETGRAARIPIGSARTKLGLPNRPGYHRHWFNDQGGRIHDALAAGYTHVEERLDGRDMKVKRRVGVNEDGTPLMAYAMEIRQEFHDEDQAAKQAGINQTEAAITDPTAPEERAYRPQEGATIEVQT